MFDIFPLEIVEKILVYLSCKDIQSVFSALNVSYSKLSEYFWKTVCIKEEFVQAHESQEWHKSFEVGANKKLGRFSHLSGNSLGVLVHVYLRTIVTSHLVRCLEIIYKVFAVDDTGTTLTQTLVDIDPVSGQFRNQFILTPKNAYCVTVLKFDMNQSKFILFDELPESIHSIFGASNKYYAAFRPKKKCFHIYSVNEKSLQEIDLPSDVKLVTEKILHEESIVISTLSFTNGYKIKVHNIETQSWCLDLKCFNSTGLSNDPSVWVGSNFIGSCDISYRLRGTYFGPFKVWNKRGKMVIQASIQPSCAPFLHCFLTNDHIILTTSEDTVHVFNSFGMITKTFNFTSTISDIKLGTGNLLFVLLENTEGLEVYDWKKGTHLYTVELGQICKKTYHSELMYCPIHYEGREFHILDYS